MSRNLRSSKRLASIQVVKPSSSKKTLSEMKDNSLNLPPLIKGNSSRKIKGNNNKNNNIPPQKQINSKINNKKLTGAHNQHNKVNNKLNLGAKLDQTSIQSVPFSNDNKRKTKQIINSKKRKLNTMQQNDDNSIDYSTNNNHNNNNINNNDINVDHNNNNNDDNHNNNNVNDDNNNSNNNENNKRQKLVEITPVTIEEIIENPMIKTNVQCVVERISDCKNQTQKVFVVISDRTGIIHGFAPRNLAIQFTEGDNVEFRELQISSTEPKYDYYNARKIITIDESTIIKNHRKSGCYSLILNHGNSFTDNPFKDISGKLIQSEIYNVADNKSFLKFLVENYDGIGVVIKMWNSSKYYIDVERKYSNYTNDAGFDDDDDDAKFLIFRDCRKNASKYNNKTEYNVYGRIIELKNKAEWKQLNHQQLQIQTIENFDEINDPNDVYFLTDGKIFNIYPKNYQLLNEFWMVMKDNRGNIKTFIIHRKVFGENYNKHHQREWLKYNGLAVQIKFIGLSVTELISL